MTAELRRREDLPKPLLDIGGGCKCCPYTAKIGGCPEECVAQAKAAGHEHASGYRLFDPLLYTTWRLTR